MKKDTPTKPLLSENTTTLQSSSTNETSNPQTPTPSGDQEGTSCGTFWCNLFKGCGEVVLDCLTAPLRGNSL